MKIRAMLVQAMGASTGRMGRKIFSGTVIGQV